MDKSPDAFRTISEVASELDLPQHVLRFWETRFSQIKPMKRGGGRRYYRPEDVELLCGIRHLLYGEGYTIKGVQRILKDQGVRFVMDIWRDAESLSGDMPEDGSSGEPAVVAKKREEAVVAVPVSPREESRVAAPVALDRRAQPRVEAATPAHDVSDQSAGPRQPAAQSSASASALETETTDFNGTDEESMPRDVLADAPHVDADPSASRSSFRFMERLRGETRRDGAPHAAEPHPLAKDDIRRLQATLFELLECKRVLDQAR